MKKVRDMENEDSGLIGFLQWIAITLTMVVICVILAVQIKQEQKLKQPAFQIIGDTLYFYPAQYYGVQAVKYVIDK